MNEEEQKQADFFAGVYGWVDEFNFSRVKRNIARDFSDGRCIAEIIHQYYPKLVEVHNYVDTCNRRQKVVNWKLLNKKVMKKINFPINWEEIDAIIDCETHAIEYFLARLRDFLQQPPVDVSTDTADFAELNKTTVEKLKMARVAEDVKEAIFNEKDIVDKRPEQDMHTLEILYHKIQQRYSKIQELEKSIKGKNKKIDYLQQILLENNLI